jgi:hypothetical protein
MSDSDHSVHLFSEKSSQKTAADEKSPENVSVLPEGIETLPICQYCVSEY